MRKWKVSFAVVLVGLFFAACDDNSGKSKECSVNTCDDNGMLVQCVNDEILPPMSCDEGKMCSEGACVDDKDWAIGQEIDVLLGECKLSEAHAKLGELTKRDERQELAWLLSSLILLAEDADFLPIAGRLGYVPKDAKWIYEKDGYLDRGKWTIDSSRCYDDYNSTLRGLYDSNTYDETTSLNDILAAANKLAPKILSISADLAKLADGMGDSDYIRVSKSSCGFEHLGFRDYELYVAAAQLSAIGVAIKYADLYEWDLSIGEALDKNYYRCEVYDGDEYIAEGLCDSSEEDEDDKPMKAYFAKINKLLTKAKKAPAAFDLVKEVDALASYIDKATDKMSNKSNFYTLGKVPAGVKEDIHAVALAIREGLKEKGSTVNLNEVLTSFTFDLRAFLETPIFHTSKDSFVILSDDYYKHYGEISIPFTFNYGNILVDFNKLWSKPLIDIELDSDGYKEVISLTTEARQNERLSSAWAYKVEDQQGERSGLEILLDGLVPDVYFDCRDYYEED